MNTINEYEKQGNDFIEKHGIKFTATWKGDKCPLWDDEKHIHGDRYIITLSRNGKRFTFDFWNSYNDAREGKSPTAYGVLATIEKNDPGDFAEFCSNYGYDEDSKKAHKTYKAVVKQWEKAERFFTPEEIEELYDIQ